LTEFLDIRHLQYTEKDVSTEQAMQEELKQVAGNLQVPVLLVGDKVLRGYDRTALLQSLSESGHVTGDQ
jgi:glutaredoxin